MYSILDITLLFCAAKYKGEGECWTLKARQRNMPKIKNSMVAWAVIDSPIGILNGLKQGVHKIEIKEENRDSVGIWDLMGST